MQLLRKLLFPVSFVYAMVVYIRNYLYDIGVFTSSKFKVKTICVGNLSVGGTGKTPMIEFLVSRLKQYQKVAVLSRGYGRKSKGFVLAKPGVSVETLGDEPFQIFKNFPEIALAVDADRCNGISILEKTIEVDVVLLDDAYQHRKVSCDSYILLTAYSNLYVDDWYMPTGSLRDSKREARRANIIIVTKCPKDLNTAQQQSIVKKLNPREHQNVVFSYLDYSNDLKGDNDIMQLEDVRGKKITLVTGIANPKPLVTYLTENKVQLEHLAFRDHHFFSDKEIALMNTKDMVLTTEKDYVRLKGKVTNLYYIGVTHKFMNKGEQQLLEEIRKH
ncbi:lipid-A-disaccharide kinase [Arenibacter nanhaiticus]|uniref:Tetraacyldisaccharide 4'-kinase n=1 Tax=Arenibacter nanhaiticus TaxID=558155 RepID=A0A1M6HYN5_9FLAO|nr:tetraacyldisaccharide 4'-kinase [Arenibacter nanhaiticus]SHJ27350.1 lipid-A-disaccharide kinase [Arenibacter nanhaiticus]